MIVYEAHLHDDDEGIIDIYFGTKREAVDAVKSSEQGGWVTRYKLAKMPKAELVLCLLNHRAFAEDIVTVYEWEPSR